LKLEADQDESDKRQQRLDTWEKRLLGLENKLKKEVTTQSIQDNLTSANEVSKRGLTVAYSDTEDNSKQFEEECAQQEQKEGTTESSQDRPPLPDQSIENSLTIASVKSEHDIKNLQNILRMQEFKLKADQEECAQLEQRLNSWEKELGNLEEEMKNKVSLPLSLDHPSLADSKDIKKNAEKLESELRIWESKLKADQEESDERQKRLDIREKELSDLAEHPQKVGNQVVIQVESIGEGDCQQETTDRIVVENNSKLPDVSNGIGSDDQQNGDEDNYADAEIKVVDSLEREKERLVGIELDEKSKLEMLEIENEDLRVKLDRVTKLTTENSEEFAPPNNEIDVDDKEILDTGQESIATALPTTESSVSDAQTLVDQKNTLIRRYEEEIKQLQEKEENRKQEDEGKDLVMAELQRQLVTTKKEAQQLSSGSYLTKLRHEIKTLKTNVRDLNKKLKNDEYTSRRNLKKKDDTIWSLERQIKKLKYEIERREKYDQKLNKKSRDIELKDRVAYLQEEISHWKSANNELETEMQDLKSKSNEIDHSCHHDEIIDDSSHRSQQSSFNSKEGSSFVLSRASSVGSNTGSIHPSEEREPSTPGEQAKKQVLGGPEPPNPNPAVPYAPGSLNDL